MRASVSRFLILGATLAVPALVHAQDATRQMLVKTPPAANEGWTGLYVGSHAGYAAGYADWMATVPGGVPTVAGSLDLFQSFNAFKGTGSYFLGMQAGYTRALPSGLAVGAEADVSFPSRIEGAQTFTSALVGTASYSEQAQFFGTVRGRFGYATGHWLFYATAGLGWTFDQFTRAQLAGIAVGTTIAPGAQESLFVVPRVGVAAGLGVEWALNSRWFARLEYLYTDYASRSVYFASAAQRFDSNLTIQSVRLGINYRIGKDHLDPDVFAKGIPALDLDQFVLHGQTTVVQQYAFPFRSPYRGPSSLVPNQGRETWDATLYAGFKLWDGAEAWINPEIDQGFGVSNTLGVAGYPYGTAFKVGASVPYARVQRGFIRQTINLGGESQKVEADVNQFAGSQKSDRVVMTVGKFSASDIFDTNKYAQNPRKDFQNWALIDSGAFDYAADAWGYTYGAAFEWYQGSWTLRGGLLDLSVVPNSTDLDPGFKQFQWVGEIERRYELFGRPGKVAVTAFLSRGRMGRFDDAVAVAQMTGEPADTAAVRRYRSRGGVSMNLEQEAADDLGLFARAGWADGEIESYEYTDIDRTVAAGAALTGKRWGRPDDTFGIAAIVNSSSGARQAYLNAGGLGILVGDGRLPNPGLEKIAEAYYSLPLASWRITFDYQFVTNPAYNRDRGPVSLIATRLHTQF